MDKLKFKKINDNLKSNLMAATVFDDGSIGIDTVHDIDARRRYNVLFLLLESHGGLWGKPSLITQSAGNFEFSVEFFGAVFDILNDFSGYVEMYEMYEEINSEPQDPLNQFEMGIAEIAPEGFQGSPELDVYGGSIAVSDEGGEKFSYNGNGVFYPSEEVYYSDLKVMEYIEANYYKIIEAAQ